MFSNDFKPQDEEGKKTNQYKFLSSGTYGCIYEKLPPDDDDDDRMLPLLSRDIPYLEKIQVNNAVLQRELALSRYIQENVPRSDFYFATLSQPEIIIQTKDLGNMTQCPVLQQENLQEFKSYQVRRIDGGTLKNAFLSLLPEFQILKMFESWHQLLETLQLLRKIRLIHLDIKRNNILMDWCLGRPILIDFGLSWKMDDILQKKTSLLDDDDDDDELHRSVWVDVLLSDSVYAPRSFDLFFMSQIVFNTKDRFSLDGIINPLTTEDIFTFALDLFLSESFFQSSTWNSEELMEFKTTYYLWLQEEITKYQTWNDFFNQSLVIHWETWDLYSLAVVFLENTRDMKIQDDLVLQWKQIIMSLPSERRRLLRS